MSDLEELKNIMLFQPEVFTYYSDRLNQMYSLHICSGLLTSETKYI